MKNGPGRFSMGSRSFVSTLDGYAKLYAISFNGESSATFTTKFLRTSFYQYSQEENDIASYTILDGTKPEFGPIRRFIALLNGADNMNVNIIQILSGDTDSNLEYITINDYWGAYTFNKSSLATLTAVKPSLPPTTIFNDVIPVPTSSHPLQEYGTTNYINFFSFMTILPGRMSRIAVSRVKSLRNTQVITYIRLKRLPYMHCLGLSKNYAIIFAHPMYISLSKIISTGVPLKSLSWEPGAGTSVYVVNIHTGDVIEFHTEARFHMHQANSFELGNRIYIDMTTYADLSILDGLTLDNLLNPGTRDDMTTNGRLVRYTIDLDARTIKQDAYRSKASTDFINRLDMPIINENYRLRRHCFIYGMVLKADCVHTGSNAIAKKNVCDETGQSDGFWMTANHYVSEPWFIPDPEARGEDDGILLCQVLNGMTGKSYSLILDARTMTEVSRAALPTRIPFTLHGRYFEDPERPASNADTNRGRNRT